MFGAEMRASEAGRCLRLGMLPRREQHIAAARQAMADTKAAEQQLRAWVPTPALYVIKDHRQLVESMLAGQPGRPNNEELPDKLLCDSCKKACLHLRKCSACKAVAYCSQVGSVCGVCGGGVWWCVCGGGGRQVARSAKGSHMASRATCIEPHGRCTALQECQKDHWKTHKVQCAELAAQRRG